MCGGTVPSRKDFTRHDEGGRVGTKVLEEVCEAVEEYKSLCIVWSASKFIESEAWKKKKTTSKNEATDILGDAYP